MTYKSLQEIQEAFAEPENETKADRTKTNSTESNST